MWWKCLEVLIVLYFFNEIERRISRWYWECGGEEVKVWWEVRRYDSYLKDGGFNVFWKGIGLLDIIMVLFLVNNFYTLGLVRKIIWFFLVISCLGVDRELYLYSYFGKRKGRELRVYEKIGNDREYNLI